jgi:CTP:molybdopterin cytidylyltransferase MocA
MSQARMCKLDLKVVEIAQLQWDIDTPEDLDALQEIADPGCFS